MFLICLRCTTGRCGGSTEELSKPLSTQKGGEVRRTCSTGGCCCCCCTLWLVPPAGGAPCRLLLLDLVEASRGLFLSTASKRHVLSVRVADATFSMASRSRNPGSATPDQLQTLNNDEDDDESTEKTVISDRTGSK